MSTLVVNQVYGPVWQGEGPSAGRHASIIRLMGCNLACQWVTPHGLSPCDESQTWDATRFDLHAQGKRMESAEIVRAAMVGSPQMVIITGGEPLLHQGQNGWAEMLWHLDYARVRVEVETNGTQVPTGNWGWCVDQFNVSPKLASSGVPRDKAINPEALGQFAQGGRAAFKFVSSTVADLDEIAQLTQEHGIAREQTWVMPAGVTREEILCTARALADGVLQRGWNLSLRQHVLVYDDEGESRG